MPKIPSSTGTVAAAAVTAAKKKVISSGGGGSVGALRAEDGSCLALLPPGSIVESASSAALVVPAAAAIAAVNVRSRSDLDNNSTATTAYPNYRHAEPNTTTMTTKKKTSVTASLVAGTTAGVVSTLILYPLDVWKIRVQASLASKSPVEILSRMVRHEGYASLYTGLTFPLLAQGMYTATAFAVKNLTQGLLAQSRNGNAAGSATTWQQRHLDTFVCGAVGGGTKGALLCTPVEYVRNQSIVSLGSESMVGILRSTLQSGRVRRLWTGVGITVARDSLGWGTLFMTYEVSRDLLGPALFGGDRHALGNCALSGAVASMFYWAAVMPLDTIKTLIQTNGAGAATARYSMAGNQNVVRPYANVTLTLQHLLHQEGGTVAGVVQRLYRGFSVGLGRHVWGGALTFSIYVWVERAF